MTSVSLGFDATVDRYWDTGSLAQEIAVHLKHKGFCVVDPKLELLRNLVLNEVEDLTPQFSHPPQEVVDGLLGVEGSALVYDVGTGMDPALEDAARPGSSSAAETTDNIAEANQFLTTMAQIMQPVLYDVLGVDVDARTSGVIHIAGDEPQDPPELTKDTCDAWMSTFLWHKLMIMLYMGPKRGTLEMQPFNEAGNTFLAELDPGALVLLRPDVLTHKLVDAEPNSTSMTMFLQSSVRTVAQWCGTGAALIPVAARLDRWIGELIAVHSMKAKMKATEHTINAYRVIVRAISKCENPRPDSSVFGLLKQGEIVRGVEVDVGARQGLPSDVWVKIKLNEGLGSEEQAAWIPTEGRATGLGKMVEKVPVETWRVYERKVLMLSEPDPGASMLDMASKGQLVFGYSKRVSDGTLWLNTVIHDDNGSWKEAWMPTEGRAIGKGMMLEKVPNVVDELPLDLQIMADHSFDKSRVRSAVRYCGYRGPGSHDAQGFVCPLFQGIDYGMEVPLTRFDIGIFYEQNYEDIKWDEGAVKVTCKHGCWVEGMEIFSAKTFNISPAEAYAMDPGQRFALELAYEGFVGSLGFPQKVLNGAMMGVYVGGGSQEWAAVDRLKGDALSDMYYTTGMAAAIQSNRTSFAMGFRGPSITYDCEASSAMVALECAHDSLNPLKAGNTYCIAQGMYCTLAPMSWPHLTRSGLLCSNKKDARCSIFDESARGYIKGEGVLAVILNPMFENVEDELVVDKSKPLLGAIAAVASAHVGRATSLHAPNGPAKVENANETLHRGQLNPLSIDYASCFGDGRLLHDAVEAMITTKVYRKDLPEGYSLPFHLDSVKGSVGMSNCSCAIFEVVKMIMAGRYGMMAGLSHLRQLNPQIDFDDRPSDILTECLHTRMRSSFACTSSDSIGGTIGHLITWGEASPEWMPEPQPLKRQMIEFWPGGGGELPEDAVPEEGYHIAGSWNGWKPEPMGEESAGVYVHTVTLGINCFEKFQIWLDGEDGRVLHPGQPWAGKTLTVYGPDEDADEYNWVIDGRPFQSEYPHNAEPLSIGEWQWWKRDQEEMKRLMDAEPDAEPVEDKEAKIEEMNALGSYEWTTQDSGNPGDEYTVTLRVYGKWRSLTWEKSKSKNLDNFMDEGTYFVAADWAEWTLEEMKNTTEGTWELEVFVSGAVGSFQILRDKDWDQVFHAGWPADGAGVFPEVLGPASDMQDSFSLEGNAGDVFRIQFQRSYEQGVDHKTISWEKVRSMTQEELQEAELKRSLAVKERLLPRSRPKQNRKRQGMDHATLGATEDGEEGIWTSGWPSGKMEQVLLSNNQDGEE